MAQKNTKLIIDEQSKEYWKWRDSILAYEELMLEALTFDLMVDNPYVRLHDYMGQLELLHNKTLRDSAWAFCNDACLTVLPLLLNARDVAIAAIFFASSVTQEKIDDVAGDAWWHHLKGSETLTVRAVQLMTEFYKENPLRKQDSKVPGSPVFNLESTRRRGELSLSQMDLDSSQYGNTPTPLGPDDHRGGTQSPNSRLSAPRQNGREGSSATVAIKREEPVDSLAALKATADLPSGEQEQQQQPSSNSNDNSTNGDSDAALKKAANHLSTHEHEREGEPLDSSSTLNESSGPDGIGGGLVSPRIGKRRSEDPEGLEEREAKRIKLDDGEDEGEIKGS